MCKKQHNILHITSNKSNHRGSWWPYNIITDHKFNYDALIDIKGHIVKSDSMFIACQPKFINSPDVKIELVPTDPIVFQFCPYGVLIHTAWGEEADDKVLKDFANLNDVIVNL